MSQIIANAKTIFWKSIFVDPNTTFVEKSRREKDEMLIASGLCFSEQKKGPVLVNRKTKSAARAL